MDRLRDGLAMVMQMVTQRLDHTISTVVKRGGMEIKKIPAYCTMLRWWVLFYVRNCTYIDNDKPTTIVQHPESFRSNAQNAIMFARKNRPRVNRSGEFACIYLRLRAFASTVRDRERARTCVQSLVRACDRAYVNSI